MHPLVDPRCGMVTALTLQHRRDGFPGEYVAYCAKVAAIERACGWRADPFAFGASLGSDDAARWAAIGEAVERYCGNAPPTRLDRASYDELQEQGSDAIHPSTLRLYDKTQYARAGFPFVPFSTDLTVHWREGIDLESHAPVLVPASLAGLNLPRALGEPPTHHLWYAGIAAGPSQDAARTSAMLELVERDAVAVWWHSGAPVVGIRRPWWPSVADVLADPSADTLRWTLLQIPTRFPVHVVAAVLEDDRNDVICLGSAARADAETAARKAITEALQELTLARELLDPGSAYWSAIAVGTLATGHAPFRADRRYADSYRDDLLDVVDLVAHTQLWLDPRWRDEHGDRLVDPPTEVPAEIGPGDGGSVLERCRRAAAAQGLRTVAVNLTTPDVRSTGLHVSRLVVPGLATNTPAAFPLGACERLRTEPVELGIATGVLTPEGLVRRPPPYS